jgi:hypothetical protein
VNCPSFLYRFFFFFFFFWQYRCPMGFRQERWPMHQRHWFRTSRFFSSSGVRHA